MIENTEANESRGACWFPATKRPPFLDPLLVAGVLEGETSESVNEGFWDGRRFLSPRTHLTGDGGSRLRIDDVRAWRFMPEPPKSEEVAP